MTVQDVRDPSAQGGSSTLTGDNIDANEAVGVSSFAGNIFWDPAKFEEIDDPFDVVNMVVNGQINMNYHNLLNSNFRTLRSGTLDNTVGSIGGIGGGIGLGNAADIIGHDGPEQLSLFHFRAEAPATDSIISMSGGGGMADLAEFEPVYAEQFINVISGVSPVLSIVDATITEVDSGTPTLVFDVILSEASQSQVSVDFTTVDITAVAQDGGSGDYVAVDGTLIFESGQTLQQISVPIVGDIIPEDTETFSVQLSNLNDNGANPLVELGNDTAIGTIYDTDVGLTVSINDPSSIVEGDSGETTLMFEVAISGEPSSDVMVDFTTADGSAMVSDNDYSANAGTLTFAAHDASSQFVSVQVTGDGKVELDENLTVTVSNVRGAPEARLDDNNALATGTLSNDDSATISINDLSMDEGNPGIPSIFTFAVTLDNDTDVPVTLDYTTVDGTAEAGSDYTATSGSLTFAAGNHDPQMIMVSMIGDEFGEPDETFSVQLSNLMAGDRNVQFANGGLGAGTVRNDDVPGLFVDDVAMVEGDTGQTEFVFSVSVGPPQPIEISVVVNSEDGTASAADNDYEPIVEQMLTFAPNEESQTVTVLVNTNQIVESNETFSLKLSNASGIEILGDTGVGTILNDDFAEINISDVTIDPEDEQVATFAVTMSREVDTDISVDFATGDVTALVADGDYEMQSGTLILTAGETEKTISISIHDDNIVERDETFHVELSNLIDGGRDVLITKGTGIGTIVDNESATLSIDDVAMMESDNGQTDYTFTVTMMGIVDADVSYDVATLEGTALQSDGDFDSNSGTMTFAAGGAAVKTQSITIQVNGDSKVELDETFSVELSNLQADGRAVSLSNATGLGTIQNDDAAGITLDDITVTEGNDGTTTTSFTANMTNEVDTFVSVDVSTSDGSAQDENGDGDYQSASNTLTFAAGSTSAMFSVTIDGDDKLESDEMFHVALSNLVAGDPMRDVSIQDGSALGTIVNDDSLPTLSIEDVEINEPESGIIDVVFTVTMSNPSETDVTVDFATAGDSAQDENGEGDFQSTSGTMTLVGDPTNSTEQTITVQVNSDDVSEQVETFTVILSNPQGATVADDTGVGTITDDPMNAEIQGNVYYTTGLPIGIPNTEITLMQSGMPLATTTTDSFGHWEFTGLRADDYEVVQQDLSGILLDGPDTIGSQGGDDTQNDRFTNVTLTASQVGTGNVFSEISLLPSLISKRNFLTSTPPLSQLLANAIQSLGSTTTDEVETVTADNNPVKFALPIPEESVSPVVISGKKATVLGTDADDVFRVVTGTTSHTITVNNMVHTVATSDISTIQIVGGDGSDAVSIVGNASANQATLGTLTTTLTDRVSTYSIEVSEVENITIDGNGDDDEAVLLDSPNDDLLVAEAQAVTMSGENFVNQVVNFELVRAVSNAGGIDIVDVKNAVDAILQLEGDWLDEVLAG